MATNPNPDRDQSYMYEMWGTTHLITDYHEISKKNTHNLEKQAKLHEKIRNDDDYDDWEYGTEPTYGLSPK